MSEQEKEISDLNSLFIYRRPIKKKIIKKKPSKKNKKKTKNTVKKTTKVTKTKKSRSKDVFDLAEQKIDWSDN